VDSHEFSDRMDITIVNGSGEHKAKSIASFNNGNSHFIIDDRCYVLVTRRFYDSSEPITYSVCAWLSNEAVEVLKTLPIPNCMGSHIVGNPLRL
jgi:hypothetical protein